MGEPLVEQKCILPLVNCYKRSEMEAIKVSNVTLEYKTIENSVIKAVDNLSLIINEGEFVVLVGHNGSGKSTLAKLFNGLLTPNKGDVTVYGINTKEKKTIFDVRKNVGMVFQNPDNQMIASIVEDDIAFGPENIGLPREEIIKRVDWALKTVGMSEHKKSTPFKMSGGQKQRLAIAGVLAIKPKIIVFDESTAMLDPKGRAEVLKVAHQLNNEEKITIILITHYMEEALEADRLIVMNEGKIVADATPKEVFKDTKQIIESNLTVPTIIDIASKLKACGMNIDTSILSEEELAEKLCKLLK